MKPRSRPQSCGLLRRKPDREVTRLKLEFQQLRKRYGQKEALRGVSITLSEGVYGLLGPNGAGKSTLMNILAGNLQADSGRILFCGEDIRRTGSDFPARLGYMPQQQTLYPGFTVERFLYYMASLRGMKRSDAAARIDWALGLLSLDEQRRKRIRSLSGGMRQRLLLAQAILADSEVLVLDEPTAGLDPQQRIFARDDLLLGQTHRDPHRRPRRAHHPNRVDHRHVAVLDREFQLHLFAQPDPAAIPELLQLGEGLGAGLFERGPARVARQIQRLDRALASLALAAEPARDLLRAGHAIDKLDRPRTRQTRPDPERHLLNDKPQHRIRRYAVKACERNRMAV